MYRIEKEGSWGADNMSAHRAFMLPGLRCPVCATTSAITGVQYPCVDPVLVASLASEFRRKLWPVPLERFQAVAQRIREAIGERYPIEPGASFGPLVRGWFRGKQGDLAWPDPWTVLIREAAAQRLAEKGVVFETARMQLRQGRPGPTRVSDLLEIQAVPCVSLHPKCLELEPGENMCSACGRRPYRWPGGFNLADLALRAIQGLPTAPSDAIVVDSTTIPPDEPILRTREFPTMLLVPDRTALAILDLKLTNVALRRVQELPG